MSNEYVDEIALYEMNVISGYVESVLMIARALRVAGEWSWGEQRKLDADIDEMRQLDADSLEIGAPDGLETCAGIMVEWERVAESAGFDAGADDGIYRVAK